MRIAAQEPPSNMSTEIKTVADYETAIKSGKNASTPAPRCARARASRAPRTAPRARASRAPPRSRARASRAPPRRRARAGRDPLHGVVVTAVQDVRPQVRRARRHRGRAPLQGRRREPGDAVALPEARRLLHAHGRRHQGRQGGGQDGGRRPGQVRGLGVRRLGKGRRAGPQETAGRGRDHDRRGRHSSAPRRDHPERPSSKVSSTSVHMLSSPRPCRRRPRGPWRPRGPCRRRRRRRGR